jgi:hypothetical protein
MMNYWTTFTPNVQSNGNATYPYNSVPGSASPAMMTSTQAPNCSFDGTGGYYVTGVSDIAWWPAADAFGSSLNTAGYTYLGVNTDGQGHVLDNGWTNFHAAVMNATDNSAYQARANANIPATIYAIGLGGNSTNPPDPVLLQRMANDPNPDLFNTLATYISCAAASNCQTFPNQPQGRFVSSPTSSVLGTAFRISRPRCYG